MQQGGNVSSGKAGRQGVAVALAYGASGFLSLPKTADGLASRKSVRVLASVRVAALDPETFAYADGYLASASRGGHAERFAVQTETPAERTRNILSRDRKNNAVHTGKVAGRLLSDGDYRYDYPGETEIRLTDALGGTALHAYDARVGKHRVTDFSGRTTTAHYFMRHDVAYLGKVRKVVDGRDRDLVSFRYDRASGKPVRVTDRLGNSRILDYDGRGNCVKLSRLAAGAFASEPVRAFSYDRQDRLAAVSELDGDGKAVRTTTFAYDGAGRPVRISDGCRTLAVAYGPSGFPSELKGDFGGLSLAYDRYGRLVEIAASGTTVRYAYDGRGRVVRQAVDGTPIDFAYTHDGRLAGKYLGGKLDPEASAEYEYTGDGRIAARTVNGVRQAYEYDARGQLLAVKEDGADVERYAYDRAGNMVRKTVRGKTTTFTFDGANQLVSSTADGVTTRYAYDAAGRLVREGAKTYRYGWLDKVLSVTDGARTYRYDWHADGQLARADYGDGTSESFLWDGLALVRRGGENFVNEPHVGGGSPVASSKGAVYFNDLLGTTVGVREGRGLLRAKQRTPRYTAAALTAFGEPLPGQGAGAPMPGAFFTGKPSVPGLGYAFLLRSYRPDLAKWQTADPFGYPDGWNRFTYGLNSPLMGCDLFGASWDNMDFVAYYFLQDSDRPNYIDTDVMGLTGSIFLAMRNAAESTVEGFVRSSCPNSAGGNSRAGFGFGVDCKSIVYALGGGSGRLLDSLSWSWYTTYEWEGDHLYECKYYEWEYSGSMRYSDSFRDPVDVLNLIKRPDLEVPGGRPYDYGHIWRDISLGGKGILNRKLIE